MRAPVVPCLVSVRVRVCGRGLHASPLVLELLVRAATRVHDLVAAAVMQRIIHIAPAHANAGRSVGRGHGPSPP